MTQLITGVEKEPIVMLAYGVPGIGKSTFAAGAPNPVFLGPERNKGLRALKFPQVIKQAQLMQYLLEIEQGKHDSNKIRTVVLDSIDMQEKIIHAEICASEPGKTMETARKGYGKAYKESGMRLMEIRDGLDRIINKKEMNVIILGHAIKVDFNDPLLATNYDTYQPCLHIGKKFDQNSIFTDWVSSILFLNWKNYATEDGNYATSIGKREIRTEFRPSHLAKNRYNLPEKIEMLDTDGQLLASGQQPQTFNIILNHIENFYNSGAVADTYQNDLGICLHQIKNLIAQVKNETILPMIEQSVNQNANNLENLIVLKNRLDEIVSNQ